MSANVETMFSVREVPWHNLGRVVQDAPTSADALHMAGLDWKVNPAPIFDQYGNKIPNFVANTRSSDNSVLGIVTDRYQVVQNEEAFSFTDALLGEGVKYETAGSLNHGKKVWMLAKMPETKILDDAFVPYLCFSSSHDGTGAIKVAITPIRVVCQNTLNIALKQASRMWSTKHVGDINYKMEEAQRTLQMASHYMTNLTTEAEELVKKNLTTGEINDLIEQLFPINDQESIRKQGNITDLRDLLQGAMNAPDIAGFRNTQWGFINAVTDMVGHSAPKRMTSTFVEKRFDKIVEGHTIVDKAYSLLKVAQEDTMNHLKNNKGFTTVELVAVIGMLVSVTAFLGIGYVAIHFILKLWQHRTGEDDQGFSCFYIYLLL